MKTRLANAWNEFVVGVHMLAPGHSPAVKRGIYGIPYTLIICTCGAKMTLRRPKPKAVKP